MNPSICLLVVMAFCSGALADTTNPVDTAQLTYNLKTTVDAYDKVGVKKATWDTDARKCLMAFARLRSTTNGNQYLKELCDTLPKLVAVKCEDPLIRYLELRFVSSNQSPEQCAASFAAIADALQKSAYPDVRKYYATYWAAANMKSVSPTNAEVAKTIERAAGYLTKALDDTSMPIREASDTCELMMGFDWWTHPGRWNCYQILEPALTNRWKGTALDHLTKGAAYLTYSWMARGTGYADSVKDKDWQLMKDRLKIAAEELEQAWKLDPKNPRICLEMMRVELGQGEGLSRLDRWFDRGMAIAPGNYDLCSAKLEYLRPRWYGSIKQMIDFGRECTSNNRYSGSVRLMLVDAHYEASREISDKQKRSEYWQQPAVWKDIQTAFEQFFKLYPDEVGYRHNYARYAVWCGEWKEFKNQIKLFQGTNYSYFGGVDRFNEMVRYADEQTNKK